MRSFLAALLTGVAIVSASGTRCAQNDLGELVSRTTCGCSKSIAACLGKGVDLESLEEIEECFVGGGCSGMNAAVEAVMIAQECHRGGGDDRDDLRKRQATNTKTTIAKTSATNVKTTTNAEAKTTSDASSASAAPSSTTAAPSSTTSVDSTTADGTTSTDSKTTTSASAASATAADSCYITSIKSTSACSIHAGTTVTCIPTTTAIQSCAAGMLCFSPTAGANSCMKKQDNLTTSGLIVTIVFAGGIGAALIAWAILCLRSRNRNKRQEALRRMMASSAKDQDVESISPFATRPTTRNKGMSSEANLPLIASGRTRGDQQTYAQQGGYIEHGPRGNTPPGPRIDPGLAALGQENRI
jgi:hypothetical protein